MLTRVCADLGVFPVVEVGAKAEVLQVDGLLFAFVYESRHLLRRGNLEGSNTTHDQLEFQRWKRVKFSPNQMLHQSTAVTFIRVPHFPVDIWVNLHHPCIIHSVLYILVGLTGGGRWFRGMRPDGVSARTVKWGVGGGPMGNGRLSASTW